MANRPYNNFAEYWYGKDPIVINDGRAQGVTVKELRSELSMIDPRKKYYGDDLLDPPPAPAIRADHYEDCDAKGCSATRCPTFMMGL